MSAFAVLINILVPGGGTLLKGRVGAGIAQFTIWVAGLAITLGTLGLGMFVGLPMMLGAWIWALVSVTRTPVPVTVVEKGE